MLGTLKRLYCNGLYTSGGMDIAAVFVLLLLVFGLAGCNSAAIYQDSSFNPPVTFGSHTVKEGETLYSIAWRYGRDYKQLAAINKISQPFRIYPGQRINLEVPPGFRYESAPAVAKAPSAPPKTTSTRPSTPVKKSPPPVAQAPKAPPKQQNTTASYKKTQSNSGSKTAQSSNKVQWFWPGTGPIIETYSTTGRINKGINLGGSIGDPVYSAANGEVVYAGSGLLGYGLLIIINHNEQYLSAYAHNHRILVKEGEQVKAGQKIAEIGSSGTNRPQLHFEIRKDGKPVNPLNYLPKR